MAEQNGTGDAERKADDLSRIGYEILALRAQMRAAMSLLSNVDGYGMADAPYGEHLTDVGFALLDADEKLSDIHSRIDEFDLRMGRTNSTHKASCKVESRYC